MRTSFILFFAILFYGFTSYGSHIMGGEITWKCQGGSYVFELVVYRDCNGAEINTVSEQIKVWNHPTLSSIQVDFISRQDISPYCNPVSGAPNPLTCGTGPNGGNGAGAIEKITYRSAPISISGVPPAVGWILTYDNFSRSGAITNLVNPSTYGITITSKMFAIAGGNGTCVDNSPQFLQAPYFTACVGNDYTYNMNAIDPDLDSISIQFSQPLNNFTGAYNPPSSPASIPFVSGFSANSPTPDASFNAGNIAATIGASSGELKFKSFNSGNFVIKVTVSSYRNGLLIAQVDREMQVVVANCSPSNNAPVINGPFGGSFETTVLAGTLVNFNLSSTDIENLQDGSPQSNLLAASGPMFGTNFTSTTGCDIAPCATLNATPLITGIQGVSTDFSWQTTCDHLENQYGIVADVVPYHFVFKVQDDYCQIPKVTYATITIHVVNPGIIQAPSIDCIQTAANGDLQINWTPVIDVNNTFQSYKIYSLQDGLIATLNTIGSSNYTIPNPNMAKDYYLSVLSGCNGNYESFSDTVSNIYLSLSNPSDGTAVLSWNDPITPPYASMGSYYYIQREYPTGIWTTIDSVPYGVHNYKDTIDICQAFLNYRIELNNVPCNFNSNIQGDDFEDMLTPDIPVISAVTIDTINSNLTLTWNQNNQPDTYGYVIYTFDANGFIYEIDTVWGISNTSYTYAPDVSAGPLSYSVAAFDSCFTNIIPPTYQTSAKALVHTTNFLSGQLSVCDHTVKLTWTGYQGWNNLQNYEVYGYETGQGWQLLGTTTNNSFNFIANPLTTYHFVVKAVTSSAIGSFSNQISIQITAPIPPAYHYLQVATVANHQILLRHHIEQTPGVQAISLQKRSTTGVFEEIAQLPNNTSPLVFIDTDVEVQKYSYTYRAQIIDSCNNLGPVSNWAKSILLQEKHDDVQMKAYLNWSSYLDFDGSINNYTLYRSINGVYSAVGVLNDGHYQFEDDLSPLDFDGKVCYVVDANESFNTYGFAETSRSNEICIVFEPLIYVPNAFIPDGINYKFLPVLTYDDPSQFLMQIYDRWGQVIFETKDQYQGWDGYIQPFNQMAETGMYVYLISFTDGGGNEHIKRGTVSLLK